MRSGKTYDAHAYQLYSATIIQGDLGGDHGRLQPMPLPSCGSADFQQRSRSPDLDVGSDLAIDGVTFH